jgi:hypothetical protein
MDKDEIIENFIDATIKHGEATEEENWKVANRQYKTIEKSYQQLKEMDEEGVNELIKLLDYDNDYVKLWSASYLLPVTEEKAKSILIMLSQKVGPPSFEAKMTLEEWEKGNLKF